MRSISLNGNWQVCSTSLEVDGLAGYRQVTGEQAEWMAVRVPGEIHLDLIRAGRLKEPLVSANALECRWPEQHAWWYATSFTLKPAFLRHERQEIVFEGLDLYAQVFLNGVCIGTACNAFVPAVFDVKPYLREGENELVVRMTVGTELTVDKPFPEGHQQPEGIYGHRDYHQRRWLRKPQFSYGWDWAEALPNIGIWRGVHLEGRSQVVLHDLRLDTIMRDDRVFVALEAMVENLHPYAERGCVLALTLTAPDGAETHRDYPLAVPPGRTPVTDELEIADPQLWWPNGMGAQPLYRVTAQVRARGTVCDQREFAIGLRTVALDRAPLPEGSRFRVLVNGQPVFCKGGNWVPADSIPARVTEQKYQALITAAKDAHINMLRVWGGGIYEDPAFYAACDRAGILVWQDFLFACKLYPDHDPAFRAAVQAEALAVVRALRHHPCIALWNGNNENIWAFAEWWTTQPDNYAGRIIYNQILPDICHAADPRRPYWPSSPAGGTMPNCQTAGDCHWWTYGTRQHEFPLIHEVFDTCRSRFVSEYGMIGPVHPASMKTFLTPEERQRDHPAFLLHTNTSGIAPVNRGIQWNYAEPDGLPLAEYLRYGQLAQALFYEGSLEALRFRHGDAVDDCHGALIWMYNDCWGEIGWTVIDYYLRRKPSYYALQRAFRPVKIITRRRGRTLVTRVVNDTRSPYRAQVQLGWMRLDGTETRLREAVIAIPANGMIEVAREPIPPQRALDPRRWLYTAQLSGDGFETDGSFYPLLPPRQLHLAIPEIAVARQGNRITLTSPVYCHRVYAEDGGQGVLSDNYFDLLPGVAKEVEYLGNGDPAAVQFCAGFIPGEPTRS